MSATVPRSAVPASTSASVAVSPSLRWPTSSTKAAVAGALGLVNLMATGPASSVAGTPESAPLSLATARVWNPQWSYADALMVASASLMAGSSVLTGVPALAPSTAAVSALKLSESSGGVLFAATDSGGST